MNQIKCPPRFVAGRLAVVGMLAWLGIVGGGAVHASPVKTSEAERIGRMVMDVAGAIGKPGDPASLEVIARHGTDSRHYVMIRGWLVQELAGAESLFQATRDPALKAGHEAKVIFLRKAIRRIDLE